MVTGCTDSTSVMARTMKSFDYSKILIDWTMNSSILGRDGGCTDSRSFDYLSSSSGFSKSFPMSFAVAKLLRMLPFIRKLTSVSNFFTHEHHVKLKRDW